MVQAIVFSGYGLNCEAETKLALELAGAKLEIVHLNDLIDEPERLKDYQIAAFPGGFSFGDDTGSGKAYANMIRNHLLAEIQEFTARDTLTIGICNGFQVLTNLGLLDGSLAHNTTAQFIDRWVDLKVSARSPWLKGIETLSLPIAHGEGRFVKQGQAQAALQYYRGDHSQSHDYQANPNGADDDIAATCSDDGRILGMMPHPERAIFFHHLPNWSKLKQEYLRQDKELPEAGPGLAIFKNAVNYFNS
ncbi:MAG: phosphoribosylformylglycinamidine synthase subunit PurQ [Candidatus Melainabacteria bacterium]|nr:phosphoribosylformylglycinamidine synthase subunit PurQ [Candidatus Melainabacteria bacterium]